MKIRLLLTYLMISSVHLFGKDAIIGENGAPELTCNQKYLEAYGLIGSDVPLDVKLGMCPNVVSSCCLYADQVTIYEQWKHGNEYGLLKKRFEYQQFIYRRVIDEALKVQEYATEVARRLKKERISNCKIYARRILDFEFKNIALRLQTALAETHIFFEKTYSGFYCTLCDAENHKYFRNNTFEIVYSKKFCRDLIFHTFNPLIYFHVHLMKYFNLLLKFTSFCDINGNYATRTISNDDLFFINQKDKKFFEICRGYRNEPESTRWIIFMNRT